MSGDTDGSSPLQTGRFVLRPPRPDDAPILAAMMTPAVSRWLGAWPVPFTPAMAAERIGDALRAQAGALGLPRIIEHREDVAVLGWIGVSRPGNDARRAVMGYWLGQAHHGRGTMREAAPAIIALAFRTWDLDAIEASTHPDNPASAAVLRGCGMRPIGERTIFAPARQREELCLMFELLRPTNGAAVTR